MKTANPMNKNILLDPFDQCAEAFSAWGDHAFQAGLEAGEEWLKTRQYALYEYRNTQLENLTDMISCPALQQQTSNIVTVSYRYAVESFNQGFDLALEKVLCKDRPSQVDSQEVNADVPNEQFSPDEMDSVPNADRDIALPDANM